MVRVCFDGSSNRLFVGTVNEPCLNMEEGPLFENL